MSDLAALGWLAVDSSEVVCPVCGQPETVFRGMFCPHDRPSGVFWVLCAGSYHSVEVARVLAAE